MDRRNKMNRRNELKRELFKIYHSDPEYWEAEITVCNKCFHASCWQGLFMCDNAINAGTIQMQRWQLDMLNHYSENSCYWKTDEELLEK